jgi:hypothetical protein
MGVSVQSLKGAKSIFIIKTNKKLLKRYSFCFNSKYKFYFEESAVTLVKHIFYHYAIVVSVRIMTSVILGQTCAW